MSHPNQNINIHLVCSRKVINKPFAWEWRYFGFSLCVDNKIMWYCARSIEPPIYVCIISTYISIFKEKWLKLLINWPRTKALKIHTSYTEWETKRLRPKPIQDMKRMYSVHTFCLATENSVQFKGFSIFQRKNRIRKIFYPYPKNQIEEKSVVRINNDLF